MLINPVASKTVELLFKIIMSRLLLLRCVELLLLTL